MGTAAESAVAQMEAMGFARSDIDRAMRAAFFNPDRAIEYLLTVSDMSQLLEAVLIDDQGIPENVQQEQHQQQPQQQQPQQQEQQERAVPSAPAQIAPPTAAPTTGGGTAGGEEPFNLFEAAAQAGDAAARGARAPGAGAAGGEAMANLDFLRNNPHFQQLRQLVQQQPHMLEPILQQVAAGNPQVAQLIGQNSEQFLQLLSEDVGGDESELPPGAQVLQVTEEERDAIERVC